jgi:hypothetical protein
VRAREKLLADGRGALAARPVLVAERSQPAVAWPPVGVHDRAGRRRCLQEGVERVAGGVLEHLQAQAPGAAPTDLDRDADERLLAALAAAAQALLQAAQEELVGLDLALSGSRLGATIARRSLCSIIHAVSWRLIPSWRCSCLAEIPGWWVAARYAAQNHRRSGWRVPCITVPAVTDVCAPQPLHCQTSRRRCITPISPPPQRRQQNPSGQREANK